MAEDNVGRNMISAENENFVKLWQYLASMYSHFDVDTFTRQMKAPIKKSTERPLPYKKNEMVTLNILFHILSDPNMIFLM